MRRKTYDIGDLKKMFAIIIIVTIIVVVFVIFWFLHRCRKLIPMHVLPLGLATFFNAAKLYEKALGKKLSSAN